MDISSIADQNARMKKLIANLIERQSHPDKVGPRITALRDALELSKAEFADSIGLDRSSLTKIEKGKAGLDIAVAEQIAGLYGCGLDYIYRGDLSDLPRGLQSDVVKNLATQTT